MCVYVFFGWNIATAHRITCLPIYSSYYYQNGIFNIRMLTPLCHFFIKSLYYKNITITSEAKPGTFLTWWEEDFCKAGLGLILWGHLLAQILLHSHTEMYSLSTLWDLTTFEHVDPPPSNPFLFTHQTQLMQLMSLFHTDVPPWYLHGLLVAPFGTFWNILW